MPSKKDLDLLKDENIDVYALLEVPFGASDSIIRKAYRKQAFIYHPDKNPDPNAAIRFHKITVSLNLLTDANLRKEYDTWLKGKKAQELKDHSLGKERKRMKDELEKAEKRSKSWTIRNPTTSNYAYAQEVERLREEGLQKRKKLEAQNMVKHESSEKVNSEYPLDRTVRVKWKSKKEIGDLFTVDVLQGIISAFGEVEAVKKLGKDPKEKKLETGRVIFKSEKDAKTATIHQFGKNSPLWENTAYRKLSSLIKSIDWYSTDETRLSLEEYTDLTILNMREYVHNKG